MYSNTTVHREAAAVTQLLIRGNFPDDRFIPWIAQRANLLNLSGWVKPVSNHLIEVVVSGNQTLIQALEVACQLGPISAQVDLVEVHFVTDSITPNRFVIIQNPPSD